MLDGHTVLLVSPADDDLDHPIGDLIPGRDDIAPILRLGFPLHRRPAAAVSSRTRRPCPVLVAVANRLVRLDGRTLVGQLKDNRAVAGWRDRPPDGARIPLGDVSPSGVVRGRVRLLHARQCSGVPEKLRRDAAVRHEGRMGDGHKLLKIRLSRRGVLPDLVLCRVVVP